MMTMSRAAHCIAAMMVGAALGCGEKRTTEPSSTSFDGRRAVADLSAMDAVLSQSSWASLRALTPRVDVTATDAQALAMETARRLLASVSPGVATAEREALPPEALGRTYAFDAVARRYVVDPARAGAPPNGVRFILYATDPATHEPVTSIELGHADLMDEGIAGLTGIALHLVVVSEGVTSLDYRFAMDGTPTTGALSVDGFASDGQTRLRFHVEARGTRSEAGAASEVAFQFAVPERGFAVAGQVQAVESFPGDTPRQRVQLTVNTGATVIGLDALSDGRAIDATVKLNGRLFATVRGDPRAPDIRGSGGRPLSPDEMNALGHIVRITESALSMFGGLLAPIEGILQLTHLV